MICQEKSALQDNYQNKVRIYSDAVLKMRRYGAALPAVEFDVLWNVVNRAHAICDAAHRALKNHIAEHRC